MSPLTLTLQRVEQYVRRNFLYAQPNFVLKPDESLIATGIMDSMGVMELVSFLEEEFGISVSDVEITDSNLGTLQAIASYVAAKRCDVPMIRAV